MKLDGWGDDQNVLTKNFTFHNFKEAMTFVQQVGTLAEKANHHPDILIHRYKHVRITLTTHDADTVTQKDFDLASKIDTL